MIVKTTARSLLVALLINSLACGNGAGGHAPPTSGDADDTSTTTATRGLGKTPSFQLHPNRTEDVTATLPFSTGVDDSGAANINIPIWVPSGRSGVEPKLSLTYSSRGGVGLLGQGFSLGGLSSIERCWKNPAVDGAFSTSTFEDQYCLGGTRLIRQGLTLEFRPEGAPGTQVSIESGTFEEPVSFVVKTRDGLLQRYGSLDVTNNAGSRTRAAVQVVNSFTGTDVTTITNGPARVVAWHLDQVSDRWANVMTVAYDRIDVTTPQLAVEVRPRTIRYTFNQVRGLPASREVSFQYFDAPQPRLRRVAQVLIRNASILEKITVKAELRTTDEARPGSMQPLREYRVAYEPAGDRLLARVKNITECFAGVGGAMKCGTPLSFTWDGLTKPRLPLFTTIERGLLEADSVPYSAAFHDVLDAATGDFNGDGFDDYLVRVGDGAADTTTQGKLVRAKWLLARGSASGLGTPSACGLPGSSGGFAALSPRVVDLDGDGKAEVLLVTQSTPLIQADPTANEDNTFTFMQSQQYDVFTFNGSTFVPRNNGETLNSGLVTDRPERSLNITIGDVDGDGRVDLMTDDPPIGSPGTGLWVRKGTASGLFAAGSRHAVPVPSLGSEKHLVDIDGNGVPELLSRSSNPSGSTAGLALDGESRTLVAVSVLNGSTRDTKIHAAETRDSVVADEMQGSTCGTSTATFRTFLSRAFADVDGDGLRDSIAYPLWDRDRCGNVRDWRGAVLTSLNLGGQYARPIPQWLPAHVGPTDPEPTRAGRIGPTMLVETNESRRLYVFGDVQEEGTPLADRANRLARSVDNGLRVIDLDGDGRDDLVNVGYLATGLGTPISERLMTVMLSNGSGFDLPIGTSVRAAEPLGSDARIFQGQPHTRGSGPRSARFGDFNGDGQLDLAMVGKQGAVKMLLEHRQEPRRPDVITAVNGGPLTANVAFTYDFAGPAKPAVYTVSNCASGLACQSRAGWVAVRWNVEASNFETEVKSRSTTYSYRNATYDRFGRGGLGFDQVTRTSHGVVETTNVDFTQKLALTNGGHVFTRPVTKQVTTVLAEGNLTDTTTTQSAFVTSSANYSRQSTTSAHTRVEGGGTVKHEETVVQYDSYETPWSTISRWRDGGSIISSLEETRSENLGVDVSNWLINRYERLEVTSTELNKPSVTRTTTFEYVPGKPDVRVINLMPNGDANQLSKFERTITFAFATDGLPTSVTSEGNDGISRVQSLAYDPVDRIYLTERGEGPYLAAVHWHAGFGLQFAEDDQNGVRRKASFDEFLRPRTVQEGVLASDDVTRGGQQYEFRYWKEQIGQTPIRRRQVCRIANGGEYQCVRSQPDGKIVRRDTVHLSGTASQRYEYNQQGHLTRESLVAYGGTPGPWIERTFDNLGRIKTETRPGEPVRTWTYPAKKMELVDERGVKHVTAVDAKGRTIRSTTTNPATNHEVRVSYEYDPFDLIAKVTHPDGVTETVNTWDALGRLERMVDPDRGVESTIYTSHGEPWQVTDANDGVTTFERDAIGRVIRVFTPANGDYPSSHANVRDDTFKWDSVTNGVGMLASATSVDGTIFTPTYDAFSRVVTKTWRVNGVDSVFSHAYDTEGRLSRLGYPDSAPGKPFAVSFEYGQGGVLTRVRDVSDITRPKQQPPKLLWQGISMHPTGVFSDQQFGTSTRDARRFDATNRLRFIESRSLTSTSSPIQKLAYEWENGGFIKNRIDLMTSSKETFGHDFLGRLTDWKVDQNCGTSEWKYSFDDLGNLTSRQPIQGPGDTLILDYRQVGAEVQPHSVKSITTNSGTQTYDYKRGGQVRSARGVTLEWMPFGLPSSASDGWTNTAYGYDAFQQRVTSSETSPSGSTWTVSLGGLYRATTTGLSTSIEYSVPGPEGLVAVVTRTLGSSPSTSTRFIHPDHQGNPDTITDESGAVVERVKFDPFGERRHPWAVGHPMVDNFVQTKSTGYTGHTSGDSFGFIDMKGRVYDPYAARFLSPDIFLRPDSEGLNRFSYVRNSPVMRIDPTGFEDRGFIASLKDIFTGKGSDSTEPIDSEEPRRPLKPTSSPTSDQEVRPEREEYDEMRQEARMSMGDSSVTIGEGVEREVANMREVADVAVSMIPHFSVGVAFSGKQPASGRKAAWWERVLAAVPIVGAFRWAGRATFANRSAHTLVAEQRLARSLGARIISVSDANFANVANGGTIKWVVTTDGQLLVASKNLAGGGELSHAVIAGGREVLAAGQAEVAIYDDVKMGISLSTTASDRLTA